MTGCSLAPEYQQPDLAVPAHFDTFDGKDGVNSNSDEHGAEAGLLSSEERRFLQEFSPHYDLAALVDRALRHNRDLQLTALRVEEARALYRIQKAAEWPAIGVNAQKYREQINDPVENARYGENLAVAGIGLSNYELDFFGRVRSLSDSAKHEYLATKYAQQAGRVALIAEVARIYVADRAAAEIQETLRAIYFAEQTTLEVVERQAGVGAAPGQDVRWQRSTAEHARLRWQQSQVDCALSRHALQLITGYSADAIATHRDIADLAGSSGETTAWFANEPSAVLTHRPDILQAEEKLRAANAVIGAARAAFFPSIQLSTGIGVASPSLHGLFDAATGAWLFTSPDDAADLLRGQQSREP